MVEIIVVGIPPNIELVHSGSRPVESRYAMASLAAPRHEEMSD